MKFLKNIKEYAHAKPKTKKLIGVVAVILGFVGVVLPVVPSLWLMFFGLELLGIQILFFDKWVKFFKQSHFAEKIFVNRIALGIVGCILVFYWYNVFLD